MTFGSLFAGIGGFDLGLEKAGFRCSWQVEIDPFCRRVLEKHWPNVKRHDDIQTFPPGDPDDWRVDVLAGGFPCKQTSTAAAVHGKRKGLEGHESGLWYAMLPVVERLGPRFVLVENPAGVSTWCAEIEGGLARAGYRTGWCDLSAFDAGAPHLRGRVFAVADRDGAGLAIARAIGSPSAERLAWRAAHRDAWLANLAGVGRGDDGLPAGVDRRRRIEAVGNAVYPACAEYIGRLIMQSCNAH